MSTPSEKAAADRARWVESQHPSDGTKVESLLGTFHLFPLPHDAGCHDSGAWDDCDCNVGLLRRAVLATVDDLRYRDRYDPLLTTIWSILSRQP